MKRQILRFSVERKWRCIGLIMVLVIANLYDHGRIIRFSISCHPEAAVDDFQDTPASCYAAENPMARGRTNNLRRNQCLPLLSILLLTPRQRRAR